MENGPAREDERAADDHEECAICLQKMELPVELPCKHIFCFLCVKGVRRSSPSARKKCALCRVDFALEAIVEQVALKVQPNEEEQPEFEWFYSAKSGEGWWLFDKKSQQEIEEAYQDPGKSQVFLSIGGFQYTLDFEKMIQFRSSDQNRHRNLKRIEHGKSSRSNKDFRIKGIAGLKLQDTGPTEEDSAVPAEQELSDSLALLQTRDATD